ncbi:SPOR domain-containing protein [Tenacibaculum sp. 190130A14a]|uniref:SPOR domain-containing protein n=1 Tax=Tenacibaculum polynesiense TaxID=3137857 RepID=A0ABM9PE22_9FLAO
MTLANYINDLLYRYDCVIVPNFGGFVTNKIGAKVNNFTHTMQPPKKQITFNTYLKHNDGLLANYVASSEKITFQQAVSKIQEEVTKWEEALKEGSVEVSAVGTLSLNDENQITFEPNKQSNFLTESFGLAEVTSPAVGRMQEVVANEPTVVTTEEEDRKTIVIPMFAKRAVAAAVVLGVGYLGWNMINNNLEQKEIAAQNKAADKKIQSATFVIDNPLPTINLNVSKEETKNFHIIAGAFQLEENATNKVNQLKEAGFDAHVVGKNGLGLIQVAFASFSSREEARTELVQIKNLISKDAWLLEK